MSVRRWWREQFLTPMRPLIVGFILAGMLTSIFYPGSFNDWFTRAVLWSSLILYTIDQRKRTHIRVEESSVGEAVVKLLTWKTYLFVIVFALASMIGFLACIGSLMVEDYLQASIYLGLMTIGFLCVVKLLRFI